MTQKQRNMVGGISVLGLAGLICKVVGVLYRIPLAAGIGPAGIGIYQQVYPSYNLMLTIASAGIPVAISRMVAAHLAQNDPRNARRVFRCSAAMLTGLGVLMAAIMMLFSQQFADATGTHEANLSFLSIAPSLFFVCTMSAFRGEMQGRRRMVPTAISQLIEQVGKVFIALPLANYLFSTGLNPMDACARGAAGALVGTSVAECVALLFMMACHFLSGKELSAIPQDETKRPLSYSYLCKHIVLVAIPISIGACIVPFANAIDSYMLVNIMSLDMPRQDALIRYGVYSGLVLPLINVPTAIAMAMSINLVPSVSTGFALNDQALVQRESATGLRLASLIGFPCSIGMSMLAEPILSVLYGGGGRYTPEQIHLGGELLTFSALTILLFTQVQATSGILQGLKKQRIPMYTLLVGVLCKITLNYALVHIPGFNIHGAP
ncbi:MAG: polysaccharide biosynthesis protein, partial [Clostridia bacterium]|nr:polysaccharide biosynthesis protein [Clostridia bacterium]